jgi:hypothetical protein
VPCPEWFNENSNRAYPFYRGIFPNQLSAVGGQGLETALLAPYTFLNQWIIDANFFLTGSSGFDPKINSIHLIRITSTFVGDVNFIFQLDCGKIFFNFGLPFLINPDAQYFTVFSPAYTADTLYIPPKKNETYVKPNFTNLSLVQKAEIGYGFITIGKVQGTSLEGANLSLRPTTHFLIEPALIQVSAKSRITSVNVANTVPLDLPECDDVDPEVTVLNSVEVVGSIDYGDVALVPGYNAVIRMNKLTNTVEISSEPGAGQGTPCEKLNDEDTDCDGLINSINGVPPDERGDFAIIGGSGVKIENLPAEHKIRIYTTADNLLCGSGV